MTYDPTSRGRDPRLWELAKRRTAFKVHLLIYLAINTFLWVLWYLTEGRVFGIGNYVPWPAWPTLSWGVALFFHFLNAHVFDGSKTIEKEYNRLKSKYKQRQPMIWNRPEETSAGAGSMQAVSGSEA